MVCLSSEYYIGPFRKHFVETVSGRNTCVMPDSCDVRHV